MNVGTNPRTVIAGLFMTLLAACSGGQADAGSAVDVAKIFADRPSELAAGTELQGCITYRVAARITPGKDDWRMEAVSFQKEAWGVIYLDMIGNPQMRDNGDCVVVRLVDAIKFQVQGTDYTGLGRAEIIRVVSHK